MSFKLAPFCLESKSAAEGIAQLNRPKGIKKANRERQIHTPGRGLTWRFLVATFSGELRVGDAACCTICSKCRLLLPFAHFICLLKLLLGVAVPSFQPDSLLNPWAAADVVAKLQGWKLPETAFPHDKYVCRHATHDVSNETLLSLVPDMTAAMDSAVSSCAGLRQNSNPAYCRRS
jgi:hypothetical protein